MKLLTKAIEKKLPKLYEQDGKGDDAIVYLKLFNPTGAGTWFILEYDGEDIFFGFADIGDPQNAELGYSSKRELESFRGCFGLGIERDRSFRSKSLREAKAEMGQAMGIG